MSQSSPKPLRIYLCGPTVYGEVHIGNLRPVVVFDLMLRAKKALGQEIIYLQNITDIDDKIIQRAREEKISEEEVAQKYTKAYLEILEAFGVESPTFLIPITKELDTICDYIQKLVDKNVAYHTPSGIYFSIKGAPSYGSISKKDPKKLLSFLEREERSSQFLENFEDKRAKEDFALWKFKTNGRLFDFFGQKGRPGWHTECSALIAKYFGSQCDIHGGGVDLIFPHHENENAQHEALFGSPLTKKWIHIGVLQLEGQKMSKSIGNTWLAKDFVAQYSADVYRLLILMTKYSAPLDLKEALLIQTTSILNKLLLIHNSYWLHNESIDSEEVKPKVFDKLKDLFEFVSNLEFSRLNKALHKMISDSQRDPTSALAISHFCSLLGFQFTKTRPGAKEREIFESWQKSLRDKNFEKADKIREKLKKLFLI